MSESVLKKFGKYFLLDRVGEGGMAEIFRARLATADGSGRLLVIKRIHGANSNNQEFLQMFRSEVQVTMRFTHANIVQLYEAGEEQNQQYIAMEFVDGRNLRQILSKLSQKNQQLPVAAVCYIIEQIAGALHYAHSFKDRISGEPLNVVHRDVSPQNIIVSYEGTIKVIDFGIAKAATNGEATRAGVIKGKLSYLSPEQVMGDTLDGRSDLFALGIVMWELLTGKRLFVAEGENEFQVLKMIESCNTFVKAPSSINSEVNADLDKIVLKALTREPGKRFQTGDEFARAIRKFMSTHFPDYSASDLSSCIKKMFQDHIVEDRKSLQQLNAQAEELIALGSNTIDLKDKEPTTRVNQFVGNKFDRSQITNADRVEIAGKPQNQVKVSFAAKPLVGTHSTRRSSAFTAPIPVQEPPSSGSFLKGLLSVAMLGGVGFGAYQYYQNLENAKQQVSTQQSKSVPVQNLNVKQVVLKLNVFPDGDLGNTHITVNSQPVDSVNRKINVAIGDLIDLRVDRPGYVTFRQEFSLKEAEIGDVKEWAKEIKLEPMKYGTLSLNTIPSFADVRVIRIDQSGRAPSTSNDTLVLKTPFVGEKLAAGSYRIVVENKNLGMEKTMTINIQEGQELKPADLQLDIKKN